MPTANWNLPLYGPTDTAELDVLLNGQSNAMDAALTSAVTRFTGTDAQRLALVAPRLREGITWRTTDTDSDWLYTGSTWVSADPGMYLLRATAAQMISNSGDSIGTNGTLEFTGLTTQYVGLSGVFTSRFRSYTVHYSMRGAANGVRFRFCNAGAVLSGANYGSNTAYMVAAVNSGVTGSGLSYAHVTNVNSSEIFGSFNIRLQSGIIPVVQGTGHAGNIPFIHAGSYSVGNVDGFAIAAAAGTDVSGWIKVYGMA